MFKISNQQADAMRAAQDQAAQAFWAYPDAEWQSNFQSNWLQSQFGVDVAQSEDGLVWGADD